VRLDGLKRDLEKRSSQLRTVDTIGTPNEEYYNENNLKRAKLGLDHVGKTGFTVLTRKGELDFKKTLRASAKLNWITLGERMQNVEGSSARAGKRIRELKFDLREYRITYLCSNKTEADKEKYRYAIEGINRMLHYEMFDADVLLGE